MEIDQSELLDQKMKRIAKMAVLFQFLAFFVAISILYFQPAGYRQLGQTFSVTALISSFVISRVYIHTGKQLETFKRFPPEEIEVRKMEYFTKFFSPYGLWILFSCIFSKI